MRRHVLGAGGQIIRDWRALTCLIEDQGRMVSKCPNCGAPLLVDEDADPENEEDCWFGWDHSPEMCVGCQYFNFHFAGCAVHPLGFDGETCPDYSSEQPN